jgi:peptidoglycan/xylan/chitin deacetylase (PgdA/CDA1 family)
MRSPETISATRVVKCVVSLGVFLFTRAAEMVSRLSGKPPNGKCVILYYHSVPANQRQQFSRQMDTLLRHTKPLSLLNAPPLRPGVHHVAVTFDDALRNLLKNAIPELERRNIPATIFAISGALGKTFGAPRCMEQVMTPEELQALPEDLITIGSHSVTHPFFPAITREAARWELRQSRADLTHVLHKDIRLFSFPFGGCSKELVELCREAGYQRVFTTQPHLAFTVPHQFALGRIRVDPTDWPFEFFLKISGAYRWLPWAFRLKRRFRSSGFLRTLLLKRNSIPKVTVPKAVIQ